MEASNEVKQPRSARRFWKIVGVVLGLLVLIGMFAPALIPGRPTGCTTLSARQEREARQAQVEQVIRQERANERDGADR